MIAYGVDYANLPRPDPGELRAAGKTFACRYVVGKSTLEGKPFTLAEAKALAEVGIDSVSNYEGASKDALRGYKGGQADAAVGLMCATLCGAPKGKPVYLSVDWDVQPAELTVVGSYFRGVADTIGLARTGAYGGYRAIKYLFDNGLIRYGWQTYAWSHGEWDPRAQLRQVKNSVRIGRGLVDLDEAYANDFGQWRPGGKDATMADYGTLGAPTDVPAWISDHPDIMTADVHAALMHGVSGWGDGSAVWLVQVLTDIQTKVAASAPAPAAEPIDYDQLAKALLRNMGGTK